MTLLIEKQLPLYKGISNRMNITKAKSQKNEILKKIGRKNKIKKTKLIFQPKLFPFPFSLLIKLTCNLYENNELCLLFKGKLSVILFNTGQTTIAKMLRDIKGINETILF